jgi:ubiquinone biosynthesis protein
VERAFRKDIDAFYLIAWVIETLSPASRRLRPRDVIAHFEGVVMQELDLRIESSAAGEFAPTPKAMRVSSCRRWNGSCPRAG